jgi:predicted ATPase
MSASASTGISEEFTIASFDSSPDRRSSRKSNASGNKVQLSRNQRLVGRDEDLKLLQGRLQTVVKDQASERVFVHGESGSGKTSLVSSFRDDVRLKNEAFFVEGGFDQHTNQPYSAIVDATTQLCNMIAESEQLDAIKSSLDKKSTLDVSVLTKLVPAMQAITDKEETENQPSRTTGNHAFRMFLDNYKNFFKAVCDIHPVVMFLDDIQWAKEDDRELFLSIASDTKNLLFIAAFRSDELDLQTVNEWFGSEEIKDMHLGALSEAHVNEIVSGVMGMQPEQTSDLSELVWRKTGGNAYFVTEYVEDLHYQDLIAYSFMKTHWEWDLQQIEARTDVSDNVVALLSRKLGKTTNDVQQVLMYAACLGQVVDRVVLQHIVREENIFESKADGTQPSAASDGKDSEQPLANPAEIKQTSRFNKAFKQAIQDGLVEKTIGDGRYKFSHNRVQQAAYELMPQGEEGACLQIRLGETLLRMSDGGEEWMFFAGVDLLMKFSSHFSTPESRIRLAQLCLEAGKRAEVKSAFIPATGYLKAGIELLDRETRWTDHYELCLELHVKAAELGRTYGDCNVTLALINETVREAKCFDDKVRVFRTKAFVLGGLDKLPEAIQACKEVFSELNISLPDNPSTAAILMEFAKTKTLLKGRKAGDLVLTLQPMVDNVQEQAMEFLHASIIFAWYGIPSNVPLATETAVCSHSATSVFLLYS